LTALAEFLSEVDQRLAPDEIGKCLAKAEAQHRQPSYLGQIVSVFVALTGLMLFESDEPRGARSKAERSDDQDQ
jgi:hypothetical protein